MRELLDGVFSVTRLQRVVGELNRSIYQLFRDAVVISPNSHSSFGVPHLPSIPLGEMSETSQKLFFGRQFCMWRPVLTLRSDGVLGASDIEENNMLSINQIRMMNGTYLAAIIKIADSDRFAASSLGLPQTIIRALGDLRYHDVARLVSEAKGFMFRLINDDPGFWLLLHSREMTKDKFIHYVLHGSKNKFANLSLARPDTQPEIQDFETEIYARYMVQFGARAALLQGMFPSVTRTKARMIYKSMTGKTSACGQQPSKIGYYFQNPSRRLQATFTQYLVRSGLSAGLNYYEALLGAIQRFQMIYGALPDKNVLALDRIDYACKFPLNGDDFNVGSCRKCRANYIISITHTKYEHPANFECPSCSGKL